MKVGYLVHQLGPIIMSKNSNWSYTATATIWPFESSNENGVAVFGTPVLFACSYVEGSEVVQAGGGVEFVAGLTVFTEYAIAKRGDMIAPGDKTATADPLTLKEANIVRAVIKYDESLFDDVPDFKIQVEHGAS